MIPFYSTRIGCLLAAMCLFVMLGGVLSSADAQRKPLNEGGGYSRDPGRGDGGGRGGGGGGSNAGRMILKLAPGIIGGLNQRGGDDEPRRPRRPRKKATVDRDVEDVAPKPKKKRRVATPPKRRDEPAPPVRVTTVPPLPVGPPERFTPPPALAATTPPFPYGRATTLADKPESRADEIVVMVQAAEPDTIATQLAQGFNLVLQETLSLALLGTSRVYRFAIPDNRPIEPIVAAMAGVPGVGFAVPNSYYWLQGSHGGQGELQYALPKLRIEAAHAVVSGRGVTVAVIDSGVDAGHPSLQGTDLKVLDIVEAGIAGPDMHGTAIAGIIAASGDLKGIAPGAKVVAVRAFAAERLGGPQLTTATTLARAVDTAFSQGARIFNMSFAGRQEPLLIALIDAAYEQGAIFVAAAGNEGPDAPPAYPAAYEKVIAITATDQSDALYVQANRGGYVLAAAPGVDILAAVTGQSFDYLSGTSFAAAHVTGIVALMKEHNPRMSAEAIRDALAEAAHDLGDEGQDPDFGAGLADAYGAVMLVGKEYAKTR